MIFISVGTQKFSMNRLFEIIDTLIEQGEIDDDVFAQIGYSEYVPRFYKFNRFVDNSTFDKKIRECTLFITHGGVGNIITALKLKKQIIVFPRLSEFGEHVDDHQLQIAEAFETQGYVLVCEKKDELSDKITNAKKFIPKEYVSNTRRFINRLCSYIDGENKNK